ncbi:MAG: hypothetical protein M3396_03005 [Actinomycetota bacterium]|nr:hypothetical protein [Actinomycetota bacterium]
MASSNFLVLFGPDRGPVRMDFWAPGGMVFGPGFSGPASPPGLFEGAPFGGGAGLEPGGGGGGGLEPGGGGGGGGGDSI